MPYQPATGKFDRFTKSQKNYMICDAFGGVSTNNNNNNRMMHDVFFFFHSSFVCLSRHRRYSGDFTDLGQSKSGSGGGGTGIGQNNNGYVPNITDYSPQSHTTLLLRNGNGTISETNFHPNGQVPSVNSTLSRNTAGSRTTTATNVDSRQDNGLPNVHGSFNSLQNSLISE